MNTMGGPLKQFCVRQMTLDDIPAVIDLQRRAFPGMPPWNEEQLARHLEIFPEGQLVTSDKDGRRLGSASSLIIDWDDYASPRAGPRSLGRGHSIPIIRLARLCTARTWA